MPSYKNLTRRNSLDIVLKGIAGQPDETCFDWLVPGESDLLVSTSPTLSTIPSSLPASPFSSPESTLSGEDTDADSNVGTHSDIDSQIISPSSGLDPYMIAVASILYSVPTGAQCYGFEDQLTDVNLAESYSPGYDTTNALQLELVPQLASTAEPTVASPEVTTEREDAFNLQQLTASLPSEPPTRSTRSKPVSSASSLDSADVDMDEAQSESDGDDADDDYIPVSRTAARRPRPPPVKKGRARAPRSKPANRARSSLSRNAQASKAQIIGSQDASEVKILRYRDLTYTYVPHSNRILKDFQRKREIAHHWLCPVCQWSQTNGRAPDLDRHIKTHFASAWACHGVPLEDAELYGVSHLKPVRVNGIWMVGGCGLKFSRRDALKRHLNNANKPCVHDPSRLSNI